MSDRIGVSDPQERIDLLLRDLRSRREGLSEREALRRLAIFGPNQLHRVGGRMWVSALVAQIVHPLALLLWAAAALALLAGLPALSGAVVVVILLNALFAFVQEMQAERATEALIRYLPPTATVVRGGIARSVDAKTLVPGDVIVISEGEQISADARLLLGALELDISAITGESAPVSRSAEATSHASTLLEAEDLVFSGTGCTVGSARALVFATGMRTELGRIAALTQRVVSEKSPLQLQVNRAAKLIALVAVVCGIAFLPLGLLAGLSLTDSAIFAIGLLVANVPEGLLPTITLALAVAVRRMARRGALVKRLTAVETLGSTTVICTDKTGTLTMNKMAPSAAWTLAGEHRFENSPGASRTHSDQSTEFGEIATALACCNNATIRRTETDWQITGDPTEGALLIAATYLGADPNPALRERDRVREYPFESVAKRMSTIDRVDDRLVLHAKGAPDELLACCTHVLDGAERRSLTTNDRARIAMQVDLFAEDGLRVLAVAERGDIASVDLIRTEVERDLTFVGLVALVDPPRVEVPGAVARCHSAGIKIVVVTGDYGLTATAIAKKVGIVRGTARVITGQELADISEQELGVLLERHTEIIFARVAPEDKLRIADAFQAVGEVVTMTGDGVNDAPGLRSADIGVAMGLSGTDVAREASDMVLTDDNFATIVDAIEEGRMVYNNIRKFILYIFAHAPPEVVPILIFALSGGAVPLPLTVMQILAIDLATETLPALALGRERAEPGLMAMPPRPSDEHLIRGSLLIRAWLLLGTVSAALVVAGFFYVLLKAGWSLGDPTGPGSALHDDYLQATTMTFVGITACQIGTAFAARTERASLWSIGVFSNRLLLIGIVFELAFTAAIVYLPPMQGLFDTAALGWDALLFMLPFPFIVWGADELRRYFIRHRSAEKFNRGQ